MDSLETRYYDKSLSRLLLRSSSAEQVLAIKKHETASRRAGLDQILVQLNSLDRLNR